MQVAKCPTSKPTRMEKEEGAETHYSLQGQACGSATPALKQVGEKHEVNSTSEGLKLFYGIDVHGSHKNFW